MRHTALLTLAIALFAFASCTNKSGNTESAATDSTAMMPSKSEKNKETTKAMYDAMMKHDTANMYKDLAADFIDYNDGNMPAMHIDSMKMMMNGWITAFPDMKMENVLYCADGDWVWVYGDISGTWKGDMMGMKANGKSFKTKDIDMWKFNADGKATEHRNVQNWMCVMGMQLGVNMAPPADKKKS